MTLCALLRCEAPVEPGSAYCFTHQRVAVAGDTTAEPHDDELWRLRRQVTCIEALVANLGTDECSGLALAEEIRKVLGR